MASTTDGTSIHTVAVQAHSNADPFQVEHQQSVRCTTRAPRGRPSTNPASREVDFPQELSPIPPDPDATMGEATSGASAIKSIDVENYEEQRKRQIASRLEEDDMIFEKFRQERARVVAESEARLVEVRRQAVEERAHYRNQGQMRKAEIQRLHQVILQADRNAYQSQNAAPVAAEELARAQLLNGGAAPGVATPPTLFAGSPHVPTNASPRRPTDLLPPMDFCGEGAGYDPEEYLMRKVLAREGVTRAKQQSRGEGADSNASILRNSPMLEAMPPGGRKGTSRGVPRQRGVGGSPHDHHHRPLNPAAPSAPLYHVTVEELERMIGDARVTDGGSCDSSPSSSGTSTTTQHSRRSHQSHHPHHSHVRAMIRLAMDPIMDAEMGLTIAITVHMVQDTEVGLEA